MSPGIVPLNTASFVRACTHTFTCVEPEIKIKGTSYLKMKIQLKSVHTHAGEKSGKVFLIHFYTVKHRCTTPFTTEEAGEAGFKMKSHFPSANRVSS